MNGHIGDQPASYGKVKLFTGEWWEIVHTAVKTAGELDIEIGAFNCPGWSQSGGPWITAEQTMRHLVASETPVRGRRKGNRGPSEPVVFDKLQSWSLSEDARIRYYSGTAVYSNTFTLDIKPSGDISIDLGKVGVMAKVKINGKYAGGVWTYPYRVDITDAVKTGDNTVEIEVVFDFARIRIAEDGENFMVKKYGKIILCQ